MNVLLNQNYFHARVTSIFKPEILFVENLISEFVHTVARNVEILKNEPSALEQNRKLSSTKPTMCRKPNWN